MAHDESLAALMRSDLADEPGISETRMFGGLAFLRHGNMLCGLYRDRGMFRVGKAFREEATRIEGIADMTVGARVMTGLVEASGEAIADGARRARLMEMALAFVRGLPPK